MKVKTLLIMFAVLSAFLLSSCNPAINPLGGKETTNLFPIRQNEKWGYINRKGEVVIQPQFEYPLPFSEGLAVACINGGKCGYIDETGRFVINPQFNSALRFSEGLAAVISEDRLGYIDKTGKYVINPQFTKSDGYGALVFSTFSEGLARVKIGDKFGFVDKTGKIIINPQFEDATPFFDGLAAVKMGSKWGFIDKEGKIVINPQFEDAQPFINGLAAVLIGKQFGYIDKTGKIVINPQFDFAAPFSDEGLAAVILDQKMGFIDKDGKYIVNPQFGSNLYTVSLDSAFLITSDLGRLSFSEGFTPVPVGDKDTKKGYADKTGKIVINPQFDIASPFYGGLAFVSTRGSGEETMGWIDKEGKYVWRETKEKSETSSNSTNSNMGTTMNSNQAVVVDSNMMSDSSSTSSSNQKTGHLITDSNLRSEANKDAASLGIQFKDAKVRILDETSYEVNGVVSTWYKIRVTEYGCSKDTNLGCGKNSSNDADEGWVNAKVVLLN
ncbi:MAG: WG repeat-containing protein [Pyrinomonadaceae bacterium]